jgi:arylsulfatase
VPTVLDVLKMKSPLSINGVAQSQIEGVSFAATFDSAKAKVPREAQYFEMMGQRAIYLDGWRAYAPWDFGKPMTSKDLDNAKWMLFNIDTDFSEADDLAAKSPDKLEEMKQLWWSMANKYKVLPLDSTSVARLAAPRPQMSGPRSKYVYFPGTGEVEAANAVDMRNRSYSITAEVEIPKGGAQGVLLAQGGMIGGMTFFVNKDQKLQFSHNYVGLEEYKVISADPVPDGKRTLGMQFLVTGPPDFKTGKGTPGTVTLFVDGKQVGAGKIAVTCPLAYSLSGDGLSCGRDTLTPVSADYHGRGEYAFTGTIRRVSVDIGEQKPMPKNPERD